MIYSVLMCSLIAGASANWHAHGKAAPKADATNADNTCITVQQGSFSYLDSYVSSQPVHPSDVGQGQGPQGNGNGPNGNGNGNGNGWGKPEAPIPDIAGRGQLIRSTEGTVTGSVSLWGLPEGALYKGHLHKAPCSCDGSGHYKNDPAGPVDDVNEMWFACTVTGGRCLAEATNNWPIDTADAEQLSIVMHDTPNGNPKMACVDLEFTSDTEGVLGYRDTDTAGSNVNLRKAKMVRNSDGTTFVEVKWKGLEDDTTYPSHVHNGPCTVASNGGGHYIRDFDTAADTPAAFVPTADTEFWTTFTSNSNGRGTASVTIDHTARAGAMSVVLHKPVTKERIACVDFVNTGSSPSDCVVVQQGAFSTLSNSNYNYPGSKTSGYEGRGQLVRSSNGKTTGSVVIFGFDKTSTTQFKGHLHDQSCADGAGAHYKNDYGSTVAVPPNEMHFVSDTINGRFLAESTESWPIPAATAGGLSIVIHDTPEGNPKWQCVDLAFEDTTAGVVGYQPGPQNNKKVFKSATMTRNSDGTTSVDIKWKKLQKNTFYKSHVHEGPCSETGDKGSGHYVRDFADALTNSNNVEENTEMWVSFTSENNKKGRVQKTFPFTGRADAMSVVLHEPGTGDRVACIDFVNE